MELPENLELNSTKSRTVSIRFRRRNTNSIKTRVAILWRDANLALERLPTIDSRLAHCDSRYSMLAADGDAVSVLVAIRTRHARSLVYGAARREAVHASTPTVTIDARETRNRSAPVRHSRSQEQRLRFEGRVLTPVICFLSPIHLRKCRVVLDRDDARQVCVCGLCAEGTRLGRLFAFVNTVPCGILRHVATCRQARRVCASQCRVSVAKDADNG